MEIIAKRAKRPALSKTGEHALEEYEQRLRTEEDLTAVTIRNYLGDLRHFAAWCEAIWKQGRAGEEASSPRHLDDQEEQALVAAVTETGSRRDRAIIVL